MRIFKKIEKLVHKINNYFYVRPILEFLAVILVGGIIIWGCFAVFSPQKSYGYGYRGYVIGSGGVEPISEKVYFNGEYMTEQEGLDLMTVAQCSLYECDGKHV
jgi:hypothetical protein